MADEVTIPEVSWVQKIYLQVLFVLRFLQLGFSAMTLYMFCYLAWHHNNHYCALYPYGCTITERENVKVPWAEILMIFTCSAAILESYVSSAFSLLRGKGQPNNTHLLISTAPIMLLYAVAYRYYYKIPNVAGECYYNQNQGIYGNVELKHCAMVTNVKWSAAIAGVSTALIFIMSTAVVALEKWRERKVLLGEAATTENTISEEREEREAGTVEPLVDV